jgi:anhydro-N-acetylmuramic acid kinase
VRGNPFFPETGQQSTLDLHILGLMSGSSLDGLDMALVRFEYDPLGHRLADWEIVAAMTRAFEAPLRDQLAQAHTLPSAELMRLHVTLGREFGLWAGAFLAERGLRADGIASHGHTVFHEPTTSRPFTLQIGEGAAMAQAAGLPVVCDFRSADVASGGSGAPMAPLGDALLFPEYDAWLNLGGIANLTWREAAGRLQARDVSGANQILNALAAERGLMMDRDGRLAAGGLVLDPLLSYLLGKGLPAPDIKALSNQWVQQHQTAVCCAWEGRVEDRLATATAFIATSVARTLAKASSSPKGNAHRLLLSGGGACNAHLTDCLRQELAPLGWLPVTAGDVVTHFKEALLMALAGLLRLYGRPNFLPEVTGARRAVSGGAVYLP